MGTPGVPQHVLEAQACNSGSSTQPGLDLPASPFDKACHVPTTECRPKGLCGSMLVPLSTLSGSHGCTGLEAAHIFSLQTAVYRNRKTFIPFALHMHVCCTPSRSVQALWATHAHSHTSSFTSVSHSTRFSLNLMRFSLGTGAFMLLPACVWPLVGVFRSPLLPSSCSECYCSRAPQLCTSHWLDLLLDSFGQFAT